MQRFAPAAIIYSPYLMHSPYCARRFRELTGYQALKTLYHNNSHTNEVVLCSSRMLHGLAMAGRGLDADHIDAAIIGALMHDVGYLMTDEEAAGTGAQFTSTHVSRGVDFAKRHLLDLPPEVLAATVKSYRLLIIANTRTG